MKTKPELQLLRESVLIPAGDVKLRGDLLIPEHATGLVLLAHGSGSSRFSPRNQYVAEKFVNTGLGTLLIDLLTDQEERTDIRTGHLRFDVAMLGDRLAEIIDWIIVNNDTEGLNLGLFGASTGAAAAILAAIRRKKWVHAVVSRGGRPDLAGSALSELQCPTQLIVGSEDADVLELNRKAINAMECPKQMAIVQGATHLFEEPGALDEVAQIAGDWFAHHLS